MGKAGELWAIWRDALTDWWADNAPQLSASLAFYTVLSLAPMLLCVIAVASLLWDREVVRSEFYRGLRTLIGPEGAAVTRALLATARQHWPAATIIGLLTFLAGSTAAFAQLQDSLNRIWGVTPKPGKAVRRFLRKRLLSFALVLGMGVLLLVSLATSTALSAAAKFASADLPAPYGTVRALHSGVLLALITVLFAAIYKVLPDVRIQWRDVWMGAAVTSLWFALGAWAIGAYVGRSGLASVYGAAGSFVVLLLWIYYSAQVFFLGAEFTEVYARRRGTPIEPDGDAEWVPGAAPAVSSASAASQSRSARTGSRKDRRRAS